MSKSPALPRERIEHPPLEFKRQEEEEESVSRTPQGDDLIESDLLGLTSRLEATNLGHDRNDDDMVKSALGRLDLELLKIPNEAMSSFLIAKRECPELINDAHRASFLWREDFDVKLASRRLVRYWERRHELFGREKFCLPLTLDGALKDDMDSIRQGYLNALPVKDAHGRCIFFINPGCLDWDKCPRESMLRAAWYLFECVGADPDAQKNGIVMLVYLRNYKFQNFDLRFQRGCSELERHFLPIRIRAIHMCCPPPFFFVLFPPVKYLIGKRLKARQVVHYGSEKDCLLSLSKFGLLPDRVPVEMGGELPFDLVAWFTFQLRLERHYFGANLSGNLGKMPKTLTLSKNTVGASSSNTSQKASTQTTADGTHDVFLGANPGKLTNHDTSSAHHESLCSSSSRASESALRMPVDGVECNRFQMMTRKRPAIFFNETNLQNSTLTESLSNEHSKSEIGPLVSFGDPSIKPVAYALPTDPTRSLRNESLTSGFQFPDPIKSGASDHKLKSAAVHVKRGRKSDPRMEKALAVRLQNPQVSLFDALQAGGFEFQGAQGISDRAVLDAENVSLKQRKNQLMRRLRNQKQFNKGQEEVTSDGGVAPKISDDSFEINHAHVSIAAKPQTMQDSPFESHDRTKQVIKMKDSTENDNVCNHSLQVADENQTFQVAGICTHSEIPRTERSLSEEDNRCFGVVGLAGHNEKQSDEVTDCSNVNDFDGSILQLSGLDTGGTLDESW